MESSSPLLDNRLGPSVCAPLARQRLNLTFFTHVAGDREVLCTASHNGEAALTLLRSQANPAASLALQPGTSILAVYPHDKRPEVIGTFIKSLARARVVIPDWPVPLAISRCWQSLIKPQWNSCSSI